MTNININVIELIGYMTISYVVFYLINRLHRWYQSIESWKYHSSKYDVEVNILKTKLNDLTYEFDKMNYEKMIKSNKRKRR
jgi:hypothetical protein